MLENNPLYTKPTAANCNEEPIHIIGSIQSYGYVLVLDRESLKIVQASVNINEFTDQSAEDIIGMNADDIFPFSFLEHLNNLVNSKDELEQRSASFKHGGHYYILLLHRSDDFLVIEIEKDDRLQMEQSYFEYSSLVSNILEDISENYNIREICELIVRKLRMSIGFNRVMAYAFDDEDNGEVIAESLENGLQSYKGLKFPSTDIPPQARRLYLVSPIRGIWNTDDVPVPIYPSKREEDGKPLDLSNSFLRSISPIHIQYLKNMEVKASFSISIVVKGKLWGLLLCHHTDSPVRLNINQRKACTFLGKILSHKIESRTEDMKIDRYRELLRTNHKITSGFVNHHDLHKAFAENKEKFLETFDCHHYALQYGDQLSFSEGLDREWLNEILGNVKLKNEKVFHTNQIVNEFQGIKWSKNLPAGVLALQLSQQLDEHLLLFRNEQIHEVHWAGKPEDGAVQKNLNPRKSFEKFTQQVGEKSVGWSSHQVQFAEEFRSQLMESIIVVNNNSFNAGKADRSHLRLRLLERLDELEKTNQRLEEELRKSRKSERVQRLSHDMAIERSNMRSIESLNR